jgi:hypothetical protein
MAASLNLETPDGRITIAQVQGDPRFANHIAVAIAAGRIPKIYELPPIPCRGSTARARQYGKKNGHNLRMWGRRVKKLEELEKSN